MMNVLPVTLLSIALMSSALGLSACKSAPADQVDAVAAVDFDDPEACASCHAAVVEEYHQSMHSRAHHDRDPIYAGVRAIRTKKEGAGIHKACARCHTPRFEADPGSPKAVVGVGCAACHDTHAGGGGKALLGPHDVSLGVTGAHGTGPAAAVIKDGLSVCQVCHRVMTSPKGVVMCATGLEHAGTLPKGKTCAACHMPRVAGPSTKGSERKDHASHQFLGPHRAWYQDDGRLLASSIDLKAKIADGELTVEVLNKSGHSFPTGFPGRMATVGCVGRDANGADVWRCKNARLGKVYVGADGKPTLAPFAAKLAQDTRIDVDAVGTYRFTPPAAVREITVRVAMRLVPPRLAKKLGISDKVEGEPRLVKSVVVRRP